MSVDILPVSARTTRKHGQVEAARTPSNLRIRYHFDNQVVTGYRETGSGYLVLRVPLGILPIYARYDQQGVNGFPNEYEFGATYGDIWSGMPSGGSGGGSGGGEWDPWFDPEDPGEFEVPEG